MKQNNNYEYYCCYPIDWNHNEDEPYEDENYYSGYENNCHQENCSHNQNYKQKQNCTKKYNNKNCNCNNDDNYECNNHKNTTKRCNCFICKIFKCFR